MAKKEYALGIIMAIVIVLGAILALGITGVIRFDEPVIEDGGESALNENLIAFIPLDQNAIDKVSGVAGTVEGGVVFENDFASFDGTGIINYPYDPDLAPQQFGVSVCAKIENNMKHSYFVSKYHSWIVQQYVNVDTGIHRLDGIVWLNNTHWQSNGQYITDKTNWHNIVFNYDGTVSELYVDTLFDSRRTLGFAVPDDERYGLAIGNRPSDMSRGFIGSIKFVRVYNQPMSEQQRQLAFNECFNI